MSTWDISRIRALAGVQPLTESYDDDDDGMSASERALLKKAEGDLKKKGVKVKDADPDKDLHALAQRRKAKEKAKEEEADKEEEDEKNASGKHPDPRHRDADKTQADKDEAEQRRYEARQEKAKKEAPKAEEKKEAPKAEEKKEEPKAEEKKEEPAAEAKRRGKAPNPESFNQHAKANAKNMTRGQFLTWAAEKHGKGKAYASALFAKYNPKSSREVKTNECYMLQHPSVPSFLLAENKMMNQYQWIDGASPMDPLVFETEAEAKKVAQYIYEWKNQTADIVKIDFSDEE